MSNRLNRNQLIEMINQDIDLPKSDVRKLIDSILYHLQDTLVEKGSVRLSGLGTFSLKSRQAFEVKHPVTGERVKVDSKMRILYRANEKLQTKISQEFLTREKRTHKRRKLIIEVPVEDHGHNRVIGELGDVSQKGILLFSKYPLRQNARFILKIKFPATLTESNEWFLKARCVRCQKSLFSDLYEVGLQVLGTAPENEEAFVDIIDQYGI